MARIRTLNELVQDDIDFYRISQPLLDTKPGSVSRDLLIDGPATQMAKLYEELNMISNLQSLRTALGTDLDKYGQNVGAVRGKGAKATVTALLTFNNLETDISVRKGAEVIAKNGVSFVILNSIVITPVLSNYYKSLAAKYRSDLDFIGINDIYALEVLAEATSAGTQGNISKYALNKVSIDGIDHVTNILPSGGGKSSESDSAFRSKILSIFSGANTGTALGYKNAVLSDTAVIDAIVIEPGDPLMTRDGTQVQISSDGTRTIISEGTGGKVDILIFGNRLQEVTDSYVYRDVSNTGNPINPANDFVLGQLAGDENKTVARKRLDNLANKVLPNQPINNIVQVSGSISGSNFLPKSVDNLGRITGNYELIRDTQAYAGSPWGFDRLHWISNKISDFPEDKTKTTFNGQDPLSFPDVLKISKIQENKPVSNENSKVNPADRSSIQLNHYPVTNVTRVFNVNTGERYVVVNQNPDGTGNINPTGRIIISGKSLPAISDILQTDYTWVFEYDPYFDFDNKNQKNNPRKVQDSIDWGFSNAVRREKSTLQGAGSFLTVTVTHNISSVISVNTFSSYSTNISLSSGRLSAVLNVNITSVISIIRSSDGVELWNTNKLDGTFSGQTIFLPTDNIANLGDAIEIIFNPIDVFNDAEIPGSFNGNQITITPSSTATAGTLVECSYISNTNTLLPSTLLSSLPAIRENNEFRLASSQLVGIQPTTHVYYKNKIYYNLRQAPSQLALTITGSISPGIITVTGTSINLIAEAVIVVSSQGLKQDLSPAIKKFLKLSSKDSVPTNIRIARINSVEKVTTTTDLEVLSSDYTFDIKGYSLFDNSFVKDESISDSTQLNYTQFQLPATINNLNQNLQIGDKLKINFHIFTLNDGENVAFSKGGTLYTNKKFALIDTIAISSGFTSGSSGSASLAIANLNQPSTRVRYKAFYDYLAPKTNERIVIDYNYQKIITDATLNLEDYRPINADVLVKATVPVLVDATLKIVVTDEFKNNTAIVLQNVQDIVTTTLNSQKLGSIVDASDLENAAYSINGVDRVRVTFFNKTNRFSSVLSIKAQKNEYLLANKINILLESR